MRYLERYELRLYICRSFQIAMQMHVFMFIKYSTHRRKSHKERQGNGLSSLNAE